MKVLSNKALSKRDNDNLKKGAIAGIVLFTIGKKYIWPQLRALTVRITPSITATFNGPGTQQR